MSVFFPAAAGWGRRSIALRHAFIAVLTTVAGFAAGAPRGVRNGWQERTFFGEGIKGTAFVPGETLPRFGFTPVRLSVDNAQTKDLRWQAEFSVGSYMMDAGLLAKSTAPVPVPAQRASDRWLFVPVSQSGPQPNFSGYVSYGTLSMGLDGPGLDSVRLHFSTSGNRQHGMVPWAISQALEPVARVRIAALTVDPASPRAKARLTAMRMAGAAGASGLPPLVGGPPNLTPFDFSSPLGDWRIWSPFARVILGTDEYAVLPPANRAALRHWVALGGALYLAPVQSGPPAQEVFGAGRIVTLARPLADAGDDAGGLMGEMGLFGLSLAIPSPGELLLQKGALADKIPPAKRVGDWLVYFFIGFAVLVAPLNLYAIAPVRRRHWLFFTVPAFSLAAVAILVGAIFLQDGVGGDGARRALVVLLPGENNAAVFQDQISRTGLLLKTGFAVADDTICATVATDDGNSQPGRALHYDRFGGRAEGDWFRGRIRQAQHLRRLSPTRARVERVGQEAGGAPIVQSSVGVTLHDFIYVDRAGVSWKADRLPPGTRVTLTPLEGNGDYGRRAEEFAMVGSAHFGQLVRSAVLNPQPDRFLARADDGELAPLPTLETIRWKDSAVLLTGVVASASGERSSP